MGMLARPRVRKALLIAGILVVLLVAVGLFGARAVISNQLHARYGGRVAFSHWWLGTSSAGLRGLALNEGTGSDSPVWASAERVETDLSLGGVLRGRWAPRRITLIRPRITFRLGADGRVLTKPPLKSGGGSTDVPEVVVQDGQVTIAQEGRPPMVVEAVRARLQRADGDAGEVLNASADSPTWGQWSAHGRFDPGFGSGKIELGSVGAFEVTDAKAATIPFVPPSVWEHIRPRGPVRVRLDVTTGDRAGVVTTGDFDGVTLVLPTLGLTAEGATGRMVVDGRVVRLDGVRGRAIGGTVAASGTLDFAASPPRFDLALDLDGVDVTKTPKSWQLAESGITGKLTGKAHLRVALTADGADLTGSEGSAVVEGASLSGVAIKSLKIAMTAQGDDLKYETTQASAGEPTRPVGWLSRPGMFARAVALAGVMMQAPAAQDAGKKAEQEKGQKAGETKDKGQGPAKEAKPAAGGLRLPRSLTTQIEFEDVDLAQIVAKARSMAIPVPFNVAGRLSLKAQAKIPLGALRTVRAYEFHGQARLKGASIAGVDLGALAAKVDLADGVLDLSELRGRFVDHPAGDPTHPPPETDPAPTEGPLPPGGFRATLHAPIDPPGLAEAHVEGLGLPIGEILAPALPRPTPVSGLVSLRVDARVEVAHLDDPKAWNVTGALNSASVRYRDTTLDRASLTASLKDGRATIPDLAATLGGHPLKAHAGFDVVAPYAYDAGLDVEDWDLDSVLAFVPALPRPAPVGGRATAHLKARGALSPWSLSADGDALVKGFRAGPVGLGDVPVRWTTEPDRVRVTIADARPLGGTLSAEANIPTHGEGPIRGSATLRKVNVAAVSDLMPGGLTLSGRVDANGDFTIRPIPKKGEAAVEGNLRLDAPDLVVQGIEAKALQAVLKVADQKIIYDAYLESLGGKIEFKGDVPISAAPAGAPAPEVNGSVQAVGFRLEGLWPALGIDGAVGKLRGLAAVDANYRTHRNHADLRTRGLAEIRNLHWGDHYPIGAVKGTVTYTPRGWQVDPLSGDVLGGVAHGSVVAEKPERGAQQVRFNLEVDRASLKRAVGFLPHLAEKLDGAATLRFAGRLGDALRADGEVNVPTATLMGFPLREVRAPAELEYAPNGGLGALHLRRWSARFSGGRLSGNARFGIGHDRSFALDNQLAAIDLESLLRVLTDARRPASGKVSGKVALSGSDPDRPATYRGRIDLDLDDASLFELPVFSQLDRFLGAARGGIFEDGDLHATIGNRQITVESFTLEGRLVQLHATGTVGFDTRLDLVVLVNTNQIISQTGQALVGVAGLSDASGRGGTGTLRFANFLSNRLLKLRVGGTLASPSVEMDPAVAVGEGAVGFFAATLKLPLGLLR